MEKDAQISVAMCTYNGEKFLLEQLKSIAAQTIKPAELVVCDDGSTDQTIKILHEFAADASFPVNIHINQERLGVGRNFFKAIRLCTSDWVVLCDQDDVWLQDRIAVFGKGIADKPEGCCLMSDAFLVNDKGNHKHQTLFSAYHLSNLKINLINSGKARNVLVRHVFATGAAMAVRRKFILQLPEPDSGFLHDEWMAWFAGQGLSLINKKTFLYRQHADQITGTDNSLTAQLQRFSQPKPKSVILLEDAITHFSALHEAIGKANLNEPENALDLLAKKIKFLDERNKLFFSSRQENPVIRFFKIVFELGLRSYWLYGAGFRTLVKDITGSGRL